MGRTGVVQIVVGLLLVTGCGPNVDAAGPLGFGGGDTGSDDAAATEGDDGDGDAADTDGDGDDAVDEGDSEAEGDAGEDGTGGGDGPASGDDDTETGDPGFPACDIYEQDCPVGQKCTVYASDGGVFPNDVRCVAVTANGQAGDGCTVSPAEDGIDDCDAGLFCQVDDPAVDTNGSCAPYCQGFSGNGNCEDPDLECALLYDGVAPLCLHPCALGTDVCPDGQSCTAQMIGDPVCVGDAWGA